MGDAMEVEDHIVVVPSSLMDVVDTYNIPVVLRLVLADVEYDVTVDMIQHRGRVNHDHNHRKVSMLAP